MRETTYDVVIVGAGQAGGQCAAALRQLGFSGSVLVIGDEPHLPYERPPLSKDYLLGIRDRDRLMLRNAAFWTEQHIDFRLSTRVAAINPDARNVTCTDGFAITYGKLVWAAGGTPRHLDWPEVPTERVHTIRTLSDIDRLQGRLAHSPDVIVIGGGFIGLEAAAVLRKLGRTVILIERETRLLARVMGSEMSAWFAHLHRQHGVELHLGTSIDDVRFADGRVDMQLSDGEQIDGDDVIVGIGIAANADILADAGAATGNGVEVDDHCRTTLDHVYAIGDCASFASPFSPNARTRLESVQNANDQAKCVAADIIGRGKPYTAVPWFWSDQYDVKLQTAGLADGATHRLWRGQSEGTPASLLYFRGNRLCAVDAVNAPLDFAHGRMLLGRTFDLSDARLSDVTIPLKDLALPD